MPRADSEYHVASDVVSTRPEHAAEVAEHINSMPGLEVHAEEKGKMQKMTMGIGAIMSAAVVALIEALRKLSGG